jgi:4,5-DOPA dioxygenase extradiol
MKSTKPMPALFVGHGSPTHILDDTPFSESLKKLARDIPHPTAILVISAHWLTHGTQVTESKNPRQIFDFYGFPDALYDVIYTPPGNPELALTIADTLSDFNVSCDHSWGLDHASWAVLKHMYPEQDIPVLEMSLDTDSTPEQHFAIGKALQFLREQNVLVIGSGNIVHNLRMIKWEVDPEPYPWVAEFDAFVKEALEKRWFDRLVHYDQLGSAAKLSIPTPDHYLPMLYTLGLVQDSDTIRFFYEGLEAGSLSMRGFVVE